MLSTCFILLSFLPITPSATNPAETAYLNHLVDKMKISLIKEITVIVG
jgi:hypothetical protein